MAFRLALYTPAWTVCPGSAGLPQVLQPNFKPAFLPRIEETPLSRALACQAPIMTPLDSRLYEIGLTTSRAYGRLLRCLLRRVYMPITRCQPSYFTL